jgi:hypothetical protein
MKARIKATGEIVDVTRIIDRYVMTHHPHTITFEKDELDFDIEDDPDYWTRLEHQAAIAAMQAQIAPNYLDSPEGVACTAYAYAHALVEKMKESI